MRHVRQFSVADLKSALDVRDLPILAATAALFLEGLALFAESIAQPITRTAGQRLPKPARGAPLPIHLGGARRRHGEQAARQDQRAPSRVHVSHFGRAAGVAPWHGNKH